MGHELRHVNELVGPSTRILLLIRASLTWLLLPLWWQPHLCPYQNLIALQHAPSAIKVVIGFEVVEELSTSKDLPTTFSSIDLRCALLRYFPRTVLRVLPFFLCAPSLLLSTVPLTLLPSPLAVTGPGWQSEHLTPASPSFLPHRVRNPIWCSCEILSQTETSYFWPGWPWSVYSATFCPWWPSR